LLARSSGYSSGNFTTHYYYFCDGNGNITYMLDYNPAMVAKYRYDPFGNTISSSGTLASANVYRFSSKEIHANSGMYYYGFRFYDPNLQRWINRDPQAEAGGMNLYAFVANEPEGRLDPDGRGTISILLKGTGIFNTVQNILSPPCLNGGTTPKQCTTVADIKLGGTHLCTYQCTPAHPTDEPLTPPPTITTTQIPLGDSCPSDPDSPSIPPIQPPVLGPAPPDPRPPYPKPVR
jgi:RHS repeat-associated protein